MAFDDLETDLTDALTAANRPLTYDEAAEALGGGMKADLVLQKVATLDDDDNVVGVSGDVMNFSDEPSDDPADDDGEPQADAEAADDDADDEEETDDEPDRDADVPEPVVTGDEPDTGDWYDLAGLRVTIDPESQKVGQRTGDTYENLPVLVDGREDTPQPDTAYYPIKIGGGRDSEETIGRLLGQLNYPVLLEGEAGTGKNTAFENFGANTNRPVNRMDFGDDTSVFDLVGEKDIVGGTSVYILGDLSKSVIFGHKFVADEISMAEGDVTSHLHAITESPGKRRLTLRGTGRTLRDLPVTDEEVAAAGGRLAAIREKWNDDAHLGRYIHPEFLFCGTTNPITYAGTSDMNGAFRSRFAVLELDYLEPKYEAQLLADKTGVDTATAEALTRLADVLREAHKNNELMCPITFRELEKTVELAGPSEEFMPIKEAAHIILTGHASQKLDKQTVKDTIEDEL